MKPLFSISLVLSLVFPVAAEAQGRTAPAAHKRPANVALSATGGTSKGSYQAGVDWTVVEFLRRTRLQAFREALKDQFFHDPGELKLRAVTGASAGNVDALLAAISWCVSSDLKISAEGSLFWKTWVSTGMRDLLGESEAARKVPPDAQEPAPFDRTFFSKTYKEDIRAFMRRMPVVDKKCEVPLGIALTRQVPVEVRIQDDLELKVPVSRFAAVVKVVSSAGRIEIGPVDPRSAELRASEPDKRLAAIGAVALPRIDGTACKAEAEIFDWMFNVVMASSSFPVAFSPRSVCYEHAGLKLFDDSTAASSHAFARFMDGGVFDNEPIAMSIGLVEWAEGRPISENRTRVPLLVLATSGGHVLRGAIADRIRLREETDSLGRLLGLAGTQQMISGAVKAAEQYELHSLARQHARDDAFKLQAALPTVIPSTRGAEIVSAMVGGFAGFFGQPFREYDFYSGIYDGLDLLAWTYLCEKGGCSQRDLMRRLIIGNILELTDTARHVLAWRFAAEYGEELEDLGGRDLDTGGENDRLRTLHAIHTALVDQVPRDAARPPVRCHASTVMEKVLCDGGFKPFIDAFIRNYARLRLEKKVTTQCAQTFHTATQPPELKYPACFEDHDFAELIEDPTVTVSRWLVKSLDRLAAAEKRLVPDGQPERSREVELLLAAYRGTDFKYRKKGLSFNPSSGYQHLNGESGRAKVAAVVGTIFPNYIAEFGNGRVIGWRLLTWHPSERLLLSTHFNWVNNRCEALAGTLAACEESVIRRSSHYEGVSVAWFLPRLAPVKLVIPDSLELRFEKSLGNEQFGHAISLSGRYLLGKIYVDLRRETPKVALGLPRESFYQLRVGVSDLNGILYWLIR